MKKIISIILALIMALSVSVVAFAADTNIKLGERTVKTLKDCTDYEFDIAIPSDGVYEIKVELLGYGELCTAFCVEGDDENCIVSYYMGKYEDDEDNFDSFTQKFIAEKGNEDVISFYSVYCESSSVKVAITVSKSSATSAALGKNKTEAAEDTYYLFTVTKDGYYNFRSENADKYDPYIFITDSNGIVDSNDDIGYEDDSDFDVTVYLKKGQSILVNIVNRGDNDGKYGQISYTISFNKKIDVEALETWWLVDSISLNIGEVFEDGIITVPYGAFPTADITAKSSDENVASVEYDSETGCIYIYANGAGTATVTVSAANGVDYSYDVKVYSAIETFFRSIIERLIEILYSILYA